MNIVLDTNVLVSGLLKAHSDAGSIIRLAISGSLAIVYDSRILAEYRDVLYRPKFRFEQFEIEAILAQFEAEGILVMPKPLQSKLPDRDDEPFLEAALAVSDAILVTGNKKDFPLPSGSGLLIFSPGEFIAHWRTKISG
ncbi:MAG: putative toxin-antitoxin system toxin component, PIN family [Syntrophomonadaceae bacterium]|nr:putative toxin-antitoxin system toxin component, PIN family [Syntrophomonadaceae bacterium]